MKEGRPKIFDSPEEMQSVIDEYFSTDAFCGEGDERIYAPTVSGLAYALGMTTETLRMYGNDSSFSATVKGAKQKIEIALEQRLYGQAVTGTIFNLKNNFGWKDKTESELSGPGGGPIQTSTVNFIPVDEND